MAGKRKVGRPKIEVTEKMLDQIKVLAGIGMKEVEICHAIGISEDTFQRRTKDTEAFREAYERGKAIIKAEVSKQLYNKIRNGDLGAIIWFEKSRYGYRDRMQVEGTVEHKGTINVKPVMERIQEYEERFKEITDK